MPDQVERSPTGTIDRSGKADVPAAGTSLADPVGRAGSTAGPCCWTAGVWGASKRSRESRAGGATVAAGGFASGLGVGMVSIGFRLVLMSAGFSASTLPAGVGVAFAQMCVCMCTHTVTHTQRLVFDIHSSSSSGSGSGSSHGRQPAPLNDHLSIFSNNV